MKQLAALFTLLLLLGCASGTQQGQGVGSIAGAIVGGVVRYLTSIKHFLFAARSF